MNKTLWIMIVIVVAIAGIWLVSSRASRSSESSVNTVTFAMIESELNSGAASLYDVRTKEEYASGHFSGAKLHDLQDIQQGNYPDEEKDMKIYVYCRSGSRSSKAASALKKAGFTNIVDLGGLGKVQSMGGKLLQ